MEINQSLLLLWRESRTRFSNQLNSLQEIDLVKKLQENSNSAGFLIQHILELELFLCKKIFELDSISIIPTTMMDGKDTGKWTNMTELMNLNQLAFQTLEETIINQQAEDWPKTVELPNIGTKTRMEALGRIISHTAYHAGQLALVLKYGK